MGLETLFNGATITTQITPPIKIAPPDNKGGSEGDWFVRLVKPKIVVQTDFGPITIAPAGEPRTNFFPLLVVGAGIIVALALVGAYFLIKE